MYSPQSKCTIVLGSQSHALPSPKKFPPDLESPITAHFVNEFCEDSWNEFKTKLRP